MASADQGSALLVRTWRSVLLERIIGVAWSTTTRSEFHNGDGALDGDEPVGDVTMSESPAATRRGFLAGAGGGRRKM
jgi:hypothetical protein